jgi:hypothetical protein
MKKIIFIVGMLTLIISCKMPNDYSDTDVSNQTQIENPSSEITDDEEENKPSNSIEDNKENSSSEIEDENDEENKPSNSIEDNKENSSSEIEDNSESNEANCCKIDENITLEELMNFKYFIRFDDKEELSNDDVRFGSNNNGTHHISIRKSINKTVFHLHVKLLNDKLYVENNSNNYPIKTVRIENNNEVHIEF